MVINPSDAVLQQLTRIADALSRQHSSPWFGWLNTMASFIAGIGTAYLTQRLQSRTTDNREQRLMRRIVYTELVAAFRALDQLVRPHLTPDGKPILRRTRITVWQPFCTYRGEQYMKDNTATFFQLPEGEVLSWIYYWFHRLDGKSMEEGGQVYGISEFRAPVAFFSDCYRRYPAFRKNLRRTVPREDFVFIENATPIHKHMYTMEELVDSGQMRVVDEEPASSKGSEKGFNNYIAFYRDPYDDDGTSADGTQVTHQIRINIASKDPLGDEFLKNVARRHLSERFKILDIKEANLRIERV